MNWLNLICYNLFQLITDINHNKLILIMSASKGKKGLIVKSEFETMCENISLSYISSSSIIDNAIDKAIYDKIINEYPDAKLDDTTRIIDVQGQLEVLPKLISKITKLDHSFSDSSSSKFYEITYVLDYSTETKGIFYRIWLFNVACYNHKENILYRPYINSTRIVLDNTSGKELDVSDKYEQTFYFAEKSKEVD